MSNRVTIEPTKFIDVRSGLTSFGVRVFDDYDFSYENNWETIPDDDMAVLKLVSESNNKIIKGVMDYVKENEIGIFIGDEYYDWDKIKTVFQDDEDDDEDDLP